VTRPRPIRVLHVAPGLGSGGVGKLLQQWYLHTNQDDFEYEIATLGPGGIFDDSLRATGCKVRSILPLRDIGTIGYLNQFNEIFKNDQYDIVHSHVGIASFLVFIPAIRHGIRSRFLHAHSNRYNNDPGRGTKGLIMWALRVLNCLLATDYVACSREAASYVFPGMAAMGGRVRVIPNGIDIEEFRFSQTARDRIRLERGAGETFVVGNVGRLSQEKNQTFLVHVFNEILRRHSNSVLWLVGEGPDRAQLEDLCAALSISNRVLFVPATLKVGSQLAGMDVFVMPSRSEGLGIAAVEAQAMGLPCFLSSNVPAEANVSGRVQFISLNAGVRHWADSILKHAEPDRQIGPTALLRGGYDIESSTASLNASYQEATSRLASIRMGRK
jgi:glycosyltransferase involved in cell wall biosynthesis